MNEECAVIGYYCIKNQQPCIQKCIKSLELLQHRGRESSGISIYNDDGWSLFKGMGLVKDIYKKYTENGDVCSVIGHNRYSTSGKQSSALNDNAICDDSTYSNEVLGSIDIQPFYNAELNISMVHNGNIQGLPYETNDSKYIFDYIVAKLKLGLTYKQVFINILNDIKGVYNLILQTKHGLFLIRDRYGVRPFSYGWLNDNIVVCGSETCAFDDAIKIKDLQPGEVIYIGDDDTIAKQTTVNRKYIHKYYHMQNRLVNPAFCIFEYLYFMNHNSRLNDNAIYSYRYKLGIALAKKDDFSFTSENTIVVGSPKSGIAAGEGYALQSGIQYKQVIHKKENIGRTFILPTDEERMNACEKAFEIDDDIINKNLIIVDDTIVRGNTFKALISNLREKNPKSIHVRIAAPKIVNPCNLGIDLPTKEELITSKCDNICEYLNADSVEFLTLNDINNIVGKNNCTKICGCFEGGQKYNDW